MNLINQKENIKAIEARIGYWAALWIADKISDTKFFEQLEKLTYVAEHWEYTDFSRAFDQVTGERI